LLESNTKKIIRQNKKILKLFSTQNISIPTINNDPVKEDDDEDNEESSEKECNQREISEEEYDFSYKRDTILPFYIASKTAPQKKLAWRMCITEDIESGWLRAYYPPPVNKPDQETLMHSKQWELSYIYYLVEHYKLCKEGKKGLA